MIYDNDSGKRGRRKGWAKKIERERKTKTYVQIEGKR